MFLLFLSPQGPLVIPLIEPPVRPPALNGSLDPLYIGICLLNYQKTRQTNPVPPDIPPDLGVGDIIEKIIDSRYIGIFTTYRQVIVIEKSRFGNYRKIIVIENLQLILVG